MRLLEEAVLTMQGKPIPERKDCTASLTIPASIPDRYIPTAEQRMDLYRRIAAIRSEEDADDVVDELIDRYGEPPRTVNNLVSVALLRAAAAEQGIREIDQRGETVSFTFGEDVDLQRVVTLSGLEKYQKRLVFSASGKPRLNLKLGKKEDVLRAARTLVEDYSALQ